jgi:hypothetical protein
MFPNPEYTEQQLVIPSEFENIIVAGKTFPFFIYVSLEIMLNLRPDSVFRLIGF